MKFATRVPINHLVIFICILLFSVVGIAIYALMIKITFAVLAWLLYDTFDLTWVNVLHSIEIGVVGGCIFGVGIIFFRFLKVKGF